VLNFLNVFVGLGGLVTPFVAGNLLAGDSVRVAYGAAFLAIAAFLIHALLKIPAPRPQAGAPVRSGHVFRQPVLYLFASITFLYTACEFGVWNWLPKYLVARGVPEATALTILSLGFALGLLVGRVVVAPVLMRVSPLNVTLAAGALMAVTTYAMLHTGDPRTAAMVVFCGGLAMAPVFPTTIAMVGNYFTRGTATAIGFAITCGFSGLTLSSPVIGWLAGPSPEGIGRGLLVLPAASLAVVAVTLVLRRVSNRRAA
jgi:fucose permease